MESTEMSNFRVGQHAVCVADGWAVSPFRTGVVVPKKGVVYTIRDIRIAFGMEALALEEILNDPWMDAAPPGEPYFNSDGFRPLVSLDRRVLERLPKRLPVDEEVRV